MTPKDYILCVLAKSPDRCMRPVQLQKSIFLLGAELSPGQLRTDDFYTFKPYDYGPFCADIYSDADQLRSEGLIDIHPSPSDTYRVYLVNNTGLRIATEKMAELDPSVRHYVSDLSRWITGLTFSQLVSAIYKKYPETEINSIFQR